MVALVACGGQATEIEHAKQARYDAELSVLLAETADVVREWYPIIEVDPSGTVETPWHQLPARRAADAWYETATNADREASRTTYLVRFHVAISGTRPARIEVVGHAAKMVADEKASEFPHASEPRWTSELADKLRVKIHAKLERFAR